MFCIVAFMILGVLGIFSATSRGLAREALDCVLRRVTLRPCTTGFDEKIKARILGSVITRSEAAARWINRGFEPLSWVFFLLLLASSAFALRGAYLFYVTGSCNGQDRSAFCVFDPKGENSEVSAVATSCTDRAPNNSEPTLKGVDLTGFPVLNAGAKDEIVMIGCYACDYSRKTYPKILELARKSRARFTFADYPVKVKTDVMTRLGRCVYRQDQAAYWRLNDLLFAADKARLDSVVFARKAIADLGLKTADAAAVDRCLDDPATEGAIATGLNRVAASNFYGTPTVFINGHPFVGPKPYRVYAISLQGLWYWHRQE